MGDGGLLHAGDGGDGAVQTARRGRVAREEACQGQLGIPRAGTARRGGRAVPKRARLSLSLAEQTRQVCVSGPQPVCVAASQANRGRATPWIAASPALGLATSQARGFPPPVGLAAAAPALDFAAPQEVGLPTTPAIGVAPAPAAGPQRPVGVAATAGKVAGAQAVPPPPGVLLLQRPQQRLQWQPVRLQPESIRFQGAQWPAQPPFLLILLGLGQVLWNLEQQQ